MKLTVFLGADHAGFELKEQLKRALTAKDYRVIDRGAKRLVSTDDYPDFGYAVAREVAAGRGWGVLVCGSAQGVCMVANKVRGVRAVAVATARDAKLARKHNDANVLCLSGWHTRFDRAFSLVLTFLNTPFSGEARHVRRLRKIAAIEKGSKGVGK